MLKFKFAFVVSGSCIEGGSTARLPANVSLSITTASPNRNTSSIPLWLPVAIIAFFKFILATVALFCCLVKRKKAKAGLDC